MKTLAKIIITLLIFGVVIVGANLARNCDYFGGVQGCMGVVEKKRGEAVNVCAICQREVCEDESICALFWNLELNNDYEPEEKVDPYEEYEPQ